MWTGAIAFGLVQIPVRMLVGERSKELSFHQLDKRDHARIKYERVNAGTGKPVAWNDIVKGYEIARDRYVVLEDSDFEKANVDATHTIDIQNFVSADDIPLEFFERPYYLAPEKTGARPYSILRDALSEKSLVAIALVVIRTRQRPCAIIPAGDALMLVTMRFNDEIVPLSSIENMLPKAANPTAQEAKLAEQLVDALTSTWDPKKYEDTYSRDLLAAIHEKAESGTIASTREDEVASSKAKAVDLLELLKQSVAANGKKAPKNEEEDRGAAGALGVKSARAKKPTRERAA